VHLGLLLGLLAAAGLAILLGRTRLGYEIRIIGLSPEAARYAGMNLARTTLLVMALGGGLAALAGVVPALWGLLYRTRSGLKVRAVGEDPRRADAMGISVAAVRYGCVLAGGLLAGLGGAYLSLAYTQIWVDNMTAGRGWIALAMVIFGAWDPLRAAAGAYLFGGVQVLQLGLQAIGIVMPTYLLMMAPHGFTVLALIIASGRRTRRRLGTPAALGMPYIRGG
jgi:simple sugar transport system permease protein